MSKYSALIKRASNATAAVALTLASLTPAVMLGSSAKAAQITGRSITMSSSKISATSVTYTAAFTTPGTLTSVVVSFCTNSPLDEATCTAPSGMSLSSATVGAGWTKDSSTANTITATLGTPASGAQTLAISAITNPSAVGTFYARIQTYDTAAAAGNKVDFGGLAMSTTNDLTINARVQEQLSFCVGSVDDSVISGSDTAAAANNDLNDCTNATFTNPGVVDLGVVGSSAVSTSPVNNTTYSGNDDTGVFMIQTNAVSGAVVSYTTAGRLKIGSECANDTSLVDQCFNSASSFTAWDAEKFGMTVKGTYIGSSKTGSGTTNLGAATAYNGTNYSWNNSSSVAATVASSNTVMDWEFATLEFKARAAATTPTGSYTTSANFVATATF